MENKTATMLVVALIAAVVGGVVGYSMGMKKTGMMAENDTKNESMMADEKMAEGEGIMVGGGMMTPDRDIVTNALDSQDHTTLVAAVQAAGLVETLQGEGPFTVFAPTNAAFDKLPAGTVDTLLLPENKAKLTGVLTYHVVPGRYRAADLTDGMTLTTVQGETLTFTMVDGKVMINDSAIVEIADVISTNGVTHVIDTVLMPSAM
ncbi:MAG: fasciclin domain-containing protein [Weeksellaceae bacterium]